MVLTVGLLSAISGLFAVEQFMTTRDLMRTAPFIAHVRVIDAHTVPGIAALEYDLQLLEALKGKLPGRLRMRMFCGLRVVNPGGAEQPAGSEWIVFLGPGSGDLYPIRSLQWGRIDVATNSESGEQVLIKQLSGLPAPASGAYHTLPEFRQLVRGVLSGAIKPGTGR